MTEAIQCQKQIDELLNLPQQSWLLGAGISKNAGIPLMMPLTDRVEVVLVGDHKRVFQSIRAQLHDTSHVEHVLSHIGDLIAIADRAKSKSVDISGTNKRAGELRELHASIQDAIRDTLRWGYVPAEGEKPECVGCKDTPIVTVDGHVRFVEAFFDARRAGLERRPPVAFFTINYDTLLEDALALCRIPAIDGFSGGAMAFWEPGHEIDDPFRVDANVQARIYKLHGSIDWVVSSEDVVVRRRDGARYPSDSGARLLIYPQATKYKVTQRDPFATLFAAFRAALVYPQPGLLAICGYSFGDDHINEEIERALRQRENQLTVLAFVSQDSSTLTEPGQGLPPVLTRWLSNDSGLRKDQVIVAGSHGIYHGSLENRCPAEVHAPHGWWSFEGVTQVLRHGPEVEV
jgi:hypothetical protein